MNVDKNRITVICAEDDQDDQILIKDAWEEARILNPLVFVNDGVELLDYLLNKGEFSDVEKYQIPGMIILDLNMPRKNGREVLAEIRNNPNICHIPIVVLTTSKAEEDIIHSYDLGVNSFITKPVKFEDFVEVMRTIKKYWFEIVEVPANFIRRK